MGVGCSACPSDRLRVGSGGRIREQDLSHLSFALDLHPIFLAYQQLVLILTKRAYQRGMISITQNRDPTFMSKNGGGFQSSPEKSVEATPNLNSENIQLGSTGKIETRLDGESARGHLEH
jgi:hypothetical protein